MDYYWPIKNEIVSFVATWMDLEIIIVSEGSQTDKDKYIILLIHKIFFKKYTNKLANIIDTHT